MCLIVFIIYVGIIFFNQQQTLASYNSQKDYYSQKIEEAKEYKEKVKYQGTKTETSHKLNNDKTSVKISSRKRQSARNTLKQNIYKDIDNEWFNKTCPKRNK